MYNDHRNKQQTIVREINGIAYTEEWNPVIECPDFYHVSSFGRLKRLARKSRNAAQPDKIIPEKIVSGTLTSKGYVRYKLNYNGKWHSKYAHRLVAFAFINQIEGKPHVNHTDGVKLHNHYSLLEWCTPQENNEHGYIMGLLKRGKKQYVNTYIKKGRHDSRKKIINILTGDIYASAKELSEIIGLSIRNIRKQVSGERYCHIPYRYLGRENDVKIKPQKVKQIKIPVIRSPRKVYIPHPIVTKKVFMFNMDGSLSCVFKSAKDAAIFINTKKETFRRWLSKTNTGYHKGYIFKYTDS